MPPIECTACATVAAEWVAVLVARRTAAVIREAEALVVANAALVVAWCAAVTATDAANLAANEARTVRVMLAVTDTVNKV